jgi:integrase
MVDGRRIRKVVKAKRKEDVLTKLRAVQERVGRGQPLPNQTTTTREWLTRWATEIVPRTVGAASADAYQRVVRLYIMPYVGTVSLARLSPEHVDAMMRSLEERRFAPNTVANARRVLRGALAVALKRGHVAMNAAALVAPPRRGAAVDDALDEDEVRKVLQAASGQRLEALAVLFLMVGLRPIEARALRWDDVDLDAATLTVTKAKTAAGRRSVPLPQFVISALRSHRARQAEERMAARSWADAGLVFPSTIGTPMDGRKLRRWWNQLTTDAGIGRRRLYSSRHTAATTMLNADVPLVVVSKTLGHASLATTADTYARVRPEYQRTGADAMQRLFGGPAGSR